MRRPLSQSEKLACILCFMATGNFYKDHKLPISDIHCYLSLYFWSMWCHVWFLEKRLPESACHCRRVGGVSKTYLPVLAVPRIAYGLWMVNICQCLLQKTLDFLSVPTRLLLLVHDKSVWNLRTDNTSERQASEIRGIFTISVHRARVI